MKTPVPAILACLIVAFLGTAAFGATYYVSTTGNDTTGNGSSGSPWATLQKAANTVVAGDTVIVKKRHLRRLPRY